MFNAKEESVEDQDFSKANVNKKPKQLVLMNFTAGFVNSHKKHIFSVSILQLSGYKQECKNVGIQY